MERHTIYVVQYWVERYEYWSDVVEPATTVFGAPRVGRDTDVAAREQLAVLRKANPTTTYRAIRRTVTQEVIG